MELPDEQTIGESYDPIFKVTTHDAAREYYFALVRRNMRVTGNTEKEARAIESENIRYYAGYASPEGREQVYRLFKEVL